MDGYLAYGTALQMAAEEPQKVAVVLLQRHNLTPSGLL